MDEPKKKYRTTLRIDVDGTIHEFGSVAEFTEEQARRYSHALIAIDQKENQEHAGNS